MDSVQRLRLAARVTYYLGWISAVCGVLVHFTVAVGLFRSLEINFPRFTDWVLKRNLFEASVMFFLICAASELRVLASSKTETTMTAAKARAA